MKNGGAMFIAVEGVDGAGKTETVRCLAERLKGVKLKTPPKAYQDMQSHFDLNDNERSEERVLARFHFYKAGLYESAISVRQLSAAGLSVIVDRWTQSTILYHRQLLGYNHPDLLIGSHLPNPDFTFVLQPPLQIILDRLRRREKHHDHSLEQDQQFLATMYDQYAALQDVVHVDSGSDSIEEVTDRIIASYLLSDQIREVGHAEDY
jgi:thymidylate kinase